MDAISEYRLSAYKIPTATPEESDGTLTWSDTTMVLVELRVGTHWGMGYTYGPEWLRGEIKSLIENFVLRADPSGHSTIFHKMVASTRNFGKLGASSMAIAAVDIALWDLRAKLQGLPLTQMLGATKASAEVYGSGGFTSYTHAEIDRQIMAWAEHGVQKFKIKIGRVPGDDLERVRVAREAIGPGGELYVDANEAYDVNQALKMAARFAEYGVSWFEQPVSCFDLEGMAELRRRFPAGMRLADGEYIFDPSQTRDILVKRSADVVQLDATRARGITGFLTSAKLVEEFGFGLSSHCAPSLHLALACACPRFLEIEYFFDHSRIESLFFDGFCGVRGGRMTPNASRPGLGLELRRADAEKFKI